MPYVSTFRAPSEYEMEMERARRQQALAEALAQQMYQPTEGGAAPIPSAAPLVRALQSFMAGRAERKATEAAERAEKAGRKELTDYIKSFEPEQRTVGMGEIAAMEATAPQIDAQGRVSYNPPSAVAAPNQQLRPAMTATGEVDLSQPMQMQVGGPLSMAQRRARALEGFESTNPLVQQIAQAQYAASTPQRQELKIGDIDPSKFTAQSIAEAQRTGDIGKLQMIPAKAEDGRTSSIKDYEYAKNQGFTGSFADWERQNRAAGATRIVMPTEGERKDTYNLNRIISAQARIRAAVAKDPTALAPSGKEAVVSSIPGAEKWTYKTQSPQRQIVAGAQAEMIDALLTLATGAAYTKEQLEAQREAFLPRWGESEESIAAKQQGIKSLAEAARVRAGRAWTPEMDAAIEEAFSPPTPPPQANPLTPEQQRRLDELERKSMQRGGRK